MLDIKLIRENPDIIRADLEKRGDTEKKALLDELIAMDKEWRQNGVKVDQLKNQRNNLSKDIGALKKEGKDVSGIIRQTGEMLEKIKKLDAENAELREKINNSMMSLPNILHDTVPVGADDTDNVEVSKWGEPRNFDFELKSHAELVEALGIADFERAAKVSGAGFNYLKGDLAYLDLAIIIFAVEFMISKGYTLVEPPFMMKRKPYEGVTDMGDFESVMYKIENEDLYLIATSEHPMAAMFSDEIIDEGDMPIKLAGFSPCFRKEIGAHGVDTKGLYRMHQFNKIEQFIFCRPEDSWQYHEELLANTEEMYQRLGLPYRVVNVCTGDIGTLAAKKYDVEVWFPRQEKYGEVASCSNCTDYQARRLGIRLGKVGGDKKIIPHTLNNTALATSRTMVAILENYQNADGTITIPEVLRKFMGGKERIG